LKGLGLTLVRITRNRRFDTKTQSYEKIWGNSNEIVFVGSLLDLLLKFTLKLKEICQIMH